MRTFQRTATTALAAWLVCGTLSACGDSGQSSSNTDGGSDSSSGGGGTGGTTASGGQTSSGGSSNGGFNAGGEGGATGCTGDQDCSPGTICDASGECVPGCSDVSPCADGLTCCDATCVDTQTDFDYCGSCTNACDVLANLSTTCSTGICTVGQCDAGFFDCDGDASNGCESASECICTPGSQQNCYTGPPGTQNVGACVGGTRTCGVTGQGYGPCLGEVIPDNELCANGIDEDCSGMADDVPDLDGDGWTVCQGDCCDSAAQGCTEPEKVNPGAYEATGNNLDDDCDPATMDASTPTNCSTVENLGALTGLQLAQAMDICQTTVANPPQVNKKWGLISAELVQPNGTATAPAAVQLGVLQTFGVNMPQQNATMGAISSGTARAPNNAGYIVPDGSGFTGGAVSGWPASTPGVGSVNDGVNLRLTLRAPTNAESFSFKFKFFSAEYPEWVNSQFNDTFLALLTSGAANLPVDKNISFDSTGGRVDVNNGFFDVCVGCPLGDAELAGTGYTSPQMGTNDAGATGWLTTTAPIVPGETFTIEYIIFDVADHSWDSLTLLDAFNWSVNPSMVGTTQD